MENAIPVLKYIFGTVLTVLITLFITETIKRWAYDKKLEKNRFYILAWLKLILKQINSLDRHITSYIEVLSDINNDVTKSGAHTINAAYIVEIDKTLLADTLVFHVTENSPNDVSYNLENMISLISNCNYLTEYVDDYFSKYKSFAERFNYFNEKIIDCYEDYVNTANDIISHSYPGLGEVKSFLTQNNIGFREKLKLEEAKEKRKIRTLQMNEKILPTFEICKKTRVTDEASKERLIGLIRICDNIIFYQTQMEIHTRDTRTLLSGQLDQLKSVGKKLVEIEGHISKIKIDSWYVSFWKNKRQAMFYEAETVYKVNKDGTEGP